ncbi:SspB family protein [Candidatus Liberibacter americanus]|uniref:Stringent starvation protein B n=1 Tax=Candidatus Liberibacter americanus str. Sao Paulo TaxID=1261131 RepID=U6B5A1_9HYPH|nr:ClpXP protease specificity-enhancing factor SspB [Candidatus Liberibacter americanus]AHA28090.1 hypothetical protein lam_744 [Candidatus Liberibacter americanus str. Sao Paulo]EMS36062.1 hypothetical protein G653_03686 [Candidatus Liberibacter americanus PW_SP]
MSDDHIRYDILTKEALRGLVKTVLSETASIGHLPGDHHFYITFSTNVRGVRISQNLRKSYPEQMTIVIQNQFWDLVVSENQFEIGLSFSNIPELLVIPFNAIKGFYDPSVNFELEFDVLAENIDDTEKTEPVLELADNLKKEKPLKKQHSNKKSKDTLASVVSLDNFRKK